MVGAFAEQIAVPASTLVPMARDFADAAAFGVTYRTAYYTLRTVAPIRPEDWVVVLGAAGGVGLAAVDIAVAMGAKVIAAASSPKLAVCAQRGALAGVDYATENLRDRIKEITGGAGARVVLDPVGGPYSEPPCGPGPRRHLRHARLRRRRDPVHPTEPGAAQGNHAARHGDPHLLHRPSRRGTARHRRAAADVRRGRASLYRCPRWTRPPSRSATSPTAGHSARSSSTSTDPNHAQTYVWALNRDQRTISSNSAVTEVLHGICRPSCAPPSPTKWWKLLEQLAQTYVSAWLSYQVQAVDAVGQPVVLERHLVERDRQLQRRDPAQQGVEHDLHLGRASC
jgi:hypothetical protein